MFSEAILIISAILPFLGKLLFLIVWWKHRFDKRFSSLPWIVASFVAGMAASGILHILVRIIHGAQVAADSAASNFLLGITVSVVFFNGLRDAVCFWMISSNLAFLITDSSANDSSHESRTVCFMAKQHRYQPVFGITLIFATLLPTILLIIQSLLGYPPSFK